MTDSKKMFGQGRVLVTGGAGFIGSHVVDRLVADGCDVVVYDNFSTGRREYLAHHAQPGPVTVVDGDVLDRERLVTEHSCALRDRRVSQVVEPGEDPYPETMNAGAVADISAADPDLVVVKGDVTCHGTQEEFDRFMEVYGGAFGDRGADGLCSAARCSGFSVRARVCCSCVIMRSPLVLLLRALPASVGDLLVSPPGVEATRPSVAHTPLRLHAPSHHAALEPPERGHRRSCDMGHS
jgi:hypothetical protein